jgi:hypothetical protein
MSYFAVNIFGRSRLNRLHLLIDLLGEMFLLKRIELPLRDDQAAASRACQ